MGKRFWIISSQFRSHSYSKALSNLASVSKAFGHISGTFVTLNISVVTEMCWGFRAFWPIGRLDTPHPLC
jgi:hypothetical protein